MCCGIYKITNKINGKVYIGSSVDIKYRFIKHKSKLKKNKHTNLHLQRTYNKYGDSIFIFKILLYCCKDDLVFYENRAIKEFKCLNKEFGYNCIPARRCDLTGSNYEETRRKISVASTNPSKETRQKMSKARKGKNNPFYGKKHTEQVRRKISESKKGKISPFRGAKHSKEARQKMSDSRISLFGKNNPSAKAVIVNGKYYSTLKEAAKVLGLHRETIPKRIKKNKPGHAWA